ncbi:hypothetical protein K1719_001088 [Acacia pycnantha]|nr:hypothetical protein K1719_001088 [Acacia pycnantha]
MDEQRRPLENIAIFNEHAAAASTEWGEGVNTTARDISVECEAVGTQSRGLSQEQIPLLPVSKYKCGFFYARNQGMRGLGKNGSPYLANMSIIMLGVQHNGLASTRYDKGVHTCQELTHSGCAQFLSAEIADPLSRFLFLLLFYSRLALYVTRRFLLICQKQMITSQ